MLLLRRLLGFGGLARRSVLFSSAGALPSVSPTGPTLHRCSSGQREGPGHVTQPPHLQDAPSIVLLDGAADSRPTRWERPPFCVQDTPHVLPPLESRGVRGAVRAPQEPPAAT
ncbi:hypothetical protein NDU88_005004 [Pleurodeles waltl]|uniref:Uncharacterized protein n=1 Tax=Pleurodeles waltl TaxID=8319 RepID=A0AAV7M938_PLEWA|nr:hypothetical protein NDU88_005004 [Pleurodeles waltl]